MRGRLDFLLERHTHRGLDQLEPTVLEVLRLGAYQLLYMDGVPAYAAVSQSVSQVRAELGPRPAGLVNAVLRKVADAGGALELFPDFDRRPEEFLSTWGSHPRWLVERWLDRWSPESVRSLVDADNRRPPVYVVPLGGEPREAVNRLAEAGLASSEVGSGTRCVRLDEAVAPEDALAVVPDAVVQDPAANLVVAYADVPKGTKVADLCAAPGGKALALSGRSSRILAVDRSEARLRMVRDNAARAGRAIELVVADARHPPVHSVDVAFVDAPCSGTGTLARRPDARWRLEPGTIAEMAALQTELLGAAADVVAPGGLLVYSTCTLEPEENRGVVDAFLASRGDYRLEPTAAVPGRYLDQQGHLELTPQEHGFDGAFAARLRRVS